ncbi:MAG: DUF1552 domain-containing protein [Verrucomicrobiales bacterium]|nr:DUF1552 domain-containing protein [Verrucomicrobiales bacterium]
MNKPWQIDRRTVLRGAGVTLALPWLEGMSFGAAAKNSAARDLPRRMCSVMFPYGVALPKDDDPARQWGWFPTGKGGKDFQLTNVLRPLEPLIDDISIFSGLSHPKCRSMNGHDTGDTFLTANNLAPGTYRNTISLDQFAAKHLGEKTRLSSLTVSTDGGIGPRTRSTTLSYNEKGQPIPALSDPKLIFQRLFGRDDASRSDQTKLENSGSILDLVREQSKSLKGKLGTADQQKLDEFETSVRDVEQRVDRAQEWLKIPLPEVDPSSIALDSNPEAPKDYIGAMYDLMFLAFQTDITRITAYQVGSYGPTLARTFPAVLGLEANWHSLAHKAGKKGGPEAIGKFDQFLAQNLARFLRRLKDSPEGEDGSSMLDRTLVLYGSSNSRTHVNKNYPLLLAGGSDFGLKHNQFLKFTEATPMSNLFVSMIQAMGIEADAFSDSTGPLNGLA